MEPIVHAHVPMMYMEHCLAAARLADARDARACGRACEGRRMDLADRIGAEHPLAADARCGSTLFSARVQSAARLVPEMLRLGLRHFRVELLRETAGPARAILDLYARALAGLIAPHDAWRQLETLAAAGVTQGTWDFP
jgi:putative protease